MNRTARISKEALQELVRIGAIYKKHVDECLIKEGDLYINLFMFPDIYTFAYHKNSKIIMTELTYFKNIIKNKVHLTWLISNELEKMIFYKKTINLRR